MVRFSGGISPLELETDTYRNVRGEERISCHRKTSTERELHFAMVCPFYEEARQVLVNGSAL